MKVQDLYFQIMPSSPWVPSPSFSPNYFSPTDNFFSWAAQKLPETIQALRTFLQGSSPLAQKMAPEIFQMIQEARVKVQEKDKNVPRVVPSELLSVVPQKVQEDPKAESTTVEISSVTEKDKDVPEEKEEKKSTEVVPGGRRRMSVKIAKKGSVFGLKVQEGTSGGTEGTGNNGKETEKNNQEIPKKERLPGVTLPLVKRKEGAKSLGDLLDKSMITSVPDESARLASSLAASFKLPFIVSSSTVTREEAQVEEEEEESIKVSGSNEVKVIITEEKDKPFVLEESNKVQEPEKKDTEIMTNNDNLTILRDQLPPSLAQIRRLSKSGTANKNKDKIQQKRKSEESTDENPKRTKGKKTIVPLDFEEVKKKIQMEDLSVEEKPRNRNFKKVQENNPRGGFEMDLEGLKGGKRSQVFPKSGNRSFTLNNKK